MPGTHILYIEDNEFNQRLTKKILEPAGFVISAAFDGIQGIKKAMDLKPDLILMDLDLPHLDGLGATAKIKSLKGLEKIPIIALTSKTTKKDREKALVAGCDGYIEKPINAETFADHVRNYMAGKRETTTPADSDRILKDFNVKLIDQLQAKVEELEQTNRELIQSKEELLKAYEQSKNWNQELQRLTKLKENIVAITSHELRTPLAIATGYSDVLLEEMVGEINDDQYRILQISNQSLGKMAELVNKITDLTRLAVKKFPMDLQKLALNETFLKVYDDLAFFMKIRKLEFKQELSDKGVNVLADKGLIIQVFSNLVKNAICFTRDGGRITASTWIEGGKCFFSLRDTGIGLEKNDLENIFDEFYQVHDATKHKTGHFEFMTRGIGVGLAFCKGIITELGGRIWAESSGLDQGSTFTLYLPRVKKE